MIYGFNLKIVGIVVGVLLSATHLFSLIIGPKKRNLLRCFPRSKKIGIIILSIDLLWTLWLTATIDLGEFSKYRTPLFIFLPVAFFLVIRFVDEFLAVRALGILALLAAEPLLEAAFLKDPLSRLLLVVLAYVWVVAGMLWVGIPYLLRDQIDWLLRSELRWKMASAAGFAYGAAILFFAIIQ